MKNHLIKLPKISKTLGVLFFVLSLLILSSIAISEYLDCAPNWEGMCGFGTSVSNVPMIFLYSYLEGITKISLVVPLVLSSAFFWSFVGILLGLVFSFMGYILKQIKLKFGERSVKLIILIAIITLLFAAYYFYALFSIIYS